MSIERVPNKAEIQHYCRRIGIAGPVSVNSSGLDLLHSAHITAIPFENLDVQANCIPPFEFDEIFAKIVSNRRGGWCYEMNGLFGFMLKGMGFNVRRVGGDVRPAGEAPERRYTHMALIVTTDDGSRLADVGFGGSLRHSLPLHEGSFEEGPFTFVLKRIGDDRWSYDECTAGGRLFGFEFDEKAADEESLRQRALEQACKEWSPFVHNLVVQRRFADRHEVLRGRVLTTTDASGIAKQVLSGQHEFEAALARLGLFPREPDRLWDQVRARHHQLFA